MSRTDPHELRDSLVADLVTESMRNTGERRGAEAEALVRPVLERMDRKESDAKHVYQPRSDDKLQRQAQAEGIAGDVQRINPSPIETPKQAVSRFEQLLRKRVRWLKSKPEYWAKIQSIQAALWLKRITPQQAESRFWDLVRDSDERTKQPWWKDERPVIVHG